MDAIASDGHISQWVKYAYATQSFGGTSYNVLTTATYIGSPLPVASYTYQASNVTANGVPLIKTCDDVRYPGPMKKIWYAFKVGGSYGQLYQEKHINGTNLVLTLTVSGSTRTEARGDGPTRTFTYGATPAGGTNVPYLLKSYTDFIPVTPRNTTTLGYDANGHVSSVQDANLHTTLFARIAATGVITKITHPGDLSYIQYTYQDPTNGYYLQKVEDELHHLTTYVRNTDMTTQEIDYPDGGIEKYTYNGYNQVLTHTFPGFTAVAGSGGTETFAYNDAAHPGQVSSYTPPATPSDTNPGAHPIRYAYDVNDHLSTVTDPRSNVTTFYHNEIGQVTIEQHDDTDGGMIGYAYNTDGTLQNTNVQLNATTWALTLYGYDDYKRLRYVITPQRSTGDATPRTTYFWYDHNAGPYFDYTHTAPNVTRLVTPGAKITTTLYDENWRKSTVTPGAGTTDAAATSYTYDKVGNLASLTDPRGNKWTYGYDVRDRLLTVDDPTLNDTDPATNDANSLGYTINYTYDVANNKKSERAANDQVVTYDTYDAMNRLTQITVGQGTTPAAVSHL